MLHLEDDLEFSILQAVAQRTYKVREAQNQSLANMIANAVGKMLTGKD